MSGSCRSAARSASEKDWVSFPISRWLTMLFLWRCRYSMGSSSVMMWQSRWVLMRSIIAASVVDLPWPVGPVTRMRPRFFQHSSSVMAGRPSWAKERILLSTSRMAAA